MADTTIAGYTFTAPTLGPSPTLAVPSFVSQASDQLAAADVYNQTGTSTVSSFQDVVKNIKSVLPTVLQGGRAIAQFVGLAQSISSGNLNIASLASRLTATISGNTGALSSILGTDVANSILNLTSQYGPIVVKTASTVQTISTANFSSLYSIGNVINSVSGTATSFGLQDNNTLGSTIAGIVGSAGKYGVSGSFGMITASLTDANALFSAATKAYPGIVASSDITSLKQIGTTLGASSSTSLSGAVSSFAGAFTLNPAASTPGSIGGSVATAAVAATPSNSGSILASALSAFNTVNSGWQEVTGAANNSLGLSSTFNLTSLLGSSSAFQSLISSGVQTLPDDGKEYVLASLYDTTDVSSELSTAFPKTIFSV